MSGTVSSTSTVPRVEYLPSDGAKLERQRDLPSIVNPIDGSRFRASFPVGYGQAAALASMLAKDGDSFYFRRMRHVRRWWWSDYWIDTGEIWKPKTGEFELDP